MFSTITSGALLGVDAYLVGVEVDIARGLPAFSMVGLLGGEVRESKERVCVALKNAGLDIPPAHITVNLSPADRKKEGTAFDLPIAVGILQSLGYFPKTSTEETLFLGEMGLNGEIRKVRGVLPIVREAVARGIKRCIVPRENVMEGAVIPGIAVHGANNIEELLAYLQCPESGEAILPATRVKAEKIFAAREKSFTNDFVEVAGQEAAKRAAQIAAAGFHNLLMIGPPGAGKSMIAKRIPGVLPPLTLNESLEVTSVVSVAGLLKEKEALITTRPFQAPHHTISLAALIGGSNIPKPGLISLAHRGV
ncbi:MAG: ATP-binding protein [Lachnospiraceae bacterium]|nr:ATP-binding protein [Lachnospiraceae bacterium]